MSREEQTMKNAAQIRAAADAIYGTRIVSQDAADIRGEVARGLDALYSEVTGEPQGTLSGEMEKEMASVRWRRWGSGIPE